MAQKKRGRRGGGGLGGLKGMLSTGFILLVIVSSVIGWAKVNNISTVPGAYNYFKSWSDQAWDCGAGDAEWNCETPVLTDPGGNPGVNPIPNPGQDNENSNEGSNSGTDDPVVAPTAPKEKVFTALDALSIAPEKDVDYDRSSWKHWTGSPCDTRETALSQQGSNVVQDPKSCKAVSGTWIDPYSGATFTNASELDIDHVIPLGYAAKHGGQDWPAETKAQFANDLTHLLAVSAKENRSKSDSGPEEYMPSNKKFHCDYSKLWVSSAAKYGISITEGDRLALKSGLQMCSN